MCLRPEQTVEEGEAIAKQLMEALGLNVRSRFPVFSKLKLLVTESGGMCLSGSPAEKKQRGHGRSLKKQEETAVKD